MPTDNRVTVYWDVVFDRITSARAADVQVKSMFPDGGTTADDARDLAAVHEIVLAHESGLIDLDGEDFKYTFSLVFDTLARLEAEYPFTLLATNA